MVFHGIVIAGRWLLRDIHAERATELRAEHVVAAARLGFSPGRETGCLCNKLARKSILPTEFATHTRHHKRDADNRATLCS